MRTNHKNSKVSPLDPALPQERLAFILEDSSTAIILSQKELLKYLPSHKAQVVIVDQEWDAISLRPDRCPESAVHLANLAYLLYTSGSTGKPKGVQIPHREVVNLLLSTQVADQVRRLAESLKERLWQLPARDSG